mmetsp:Transcript_18697/g.59216  ORF Transcript_18697/g.59216 Transcript_18697/m.59216 type:complete len:235 (+) Transcript_18697:297-1001(+)
MMAHASSRGVLTQGPQNTIVGQPCIQGGVRAHRARALSMMLSTSSPALWRMMGPASSLGAWTLRRPTLTRQRPALMVLAPSPCAAARIRTRRITHRRPRWTMARASGLGAWIPWRPTTIPGPHSMTADARFQHRPRRSRHTAPPVLPVPPVSLRVCTPSRCWERQTKQRRRQTKGTARLPTRPHRQPVYFLLWARRSLRELSSSWAQWVDHSRSAPSSPAAPSLCAPTCSTGGG